MAFLVIVLIGVAIGAVVYFLDRRSTAKTIAQASVPSVPSQPESAKQELKNDLKVNVPRGTEQK